MNVDMKIIKELIEYVIDAVVNEKIEVSIDISPEACSVDLRPWKPYEMKCPYSKE